MRACASKFPKQRRIHTYPAGTPARKDALEAEGVAKPSARSVDAKPEHAEAVAQLQAALQSGARPGPSPVGVGCGVQRCFACLCAEPASIA